MITADVREKNEKLSIDDTLDILKSGQYGLLSTIGINGYPYEVPLSYVYYKENIYFHIALEGHKLENIETNSKVSFCVTLDLDLMPNEFSSKYKSVVVFGRAKEIFNEEKEDALLAIMEKYTKDRVEEGKKYIEAAVDKTKVIKIEVEHITGKSVL